MEFPNIELIVIL